MAETDVKGAWRATIHTLFPDMFPGPLGQSLLGRALHEGLWTLETVDLRTHGLGRHRTVDGPPAGGGPGMVMRPDVVAAALDARPRPGPAFYLSPRGRPMTQGLMRALAEGPGVTLLCGRFEGVDQRVLEARGLEELSLGDFVMTGGEIAAMALIDATVRLIPRVLGNAGSVEDESFSHGLLEAPHYTKPAEWDGRAIPEVLLSGHHAEIARWRRNEAERLTKDRRPDLWRALSEAEGSGPDGELERSGGNENAGKHVPPGKGRPT
ncbi:MAG: tRNA (guanosine(37)-N1)-methyltransferase TrmD [Pseudomonadota bacterium]